MDSLDLSRRAVAAGWKWQAGTLAICNGSTMRIDGADVDGRPVRYESEMPGGSCECHPGFRGQETLPDFNDAATRGVLLEQVRERWGDEHLCPAWTGTNVYGWVVRDRDGKMLVWGHDSEPAALLAALEAAPKR